MHEHIPFALTRDGLLVDIYDVPKGIKCQCICPSCKTPLVARHGTINQWHFAHASRTVHKTTQQKCDYSFFVSVRLMSRQVFDIDTMNIDLPEYVINLRDRGNIKECSITPKRTVTLSNITIEKSINGIPVDVVAHISGYPFAIYFIHKGRTLPNELNCQDINMGVITIDLTETRWLFKSRKQSYLPLLREYLERNLSHKQWIFHPREVIEKNKVMIYLSKLPAKVPERQHSKNNYKSYRVPTILPAVTSHAMLSAHSKDVLAAFKCQRCQSKWQTNRRTGNICKHCQTHLYSIEVPLG